MNEKDPDYVKHSNGFEKVDDFNPIPEGTEQLTYETQVNHIHYISVHHI